MLLKWSALALFTFVCLQGRFARGEHNVFQIISDHVRVKEAAVSYAVHKSSQTKRIVFKLNLFKKKSICNVSKAVKVAFCKRILRVDYYGFVMRTENYENTDCVHREFSVKPSSDATANTYQLRMLMCPRFSFTDLKWDSVSYWNFQHVIRVSRAREQNAAIVFVQKNFESPLHPIYLVKNIDFKELVETEREDVQRVAEQSTFIDTSTTTTENRMIQYLRNKRITNPYQKFIQLFRSLNVCGLRLVQKICLCRLAFQPFSHPASFDVGKFYENACKKRRVQFGADERNFEIRGQLYAILCPPAVYGFFPRDKRQPILFYLSANAMPTSLTLYLRPNKRAHLLQHVGVAVNVNTLPIVQDNRRAKFMIYPSEHERIRKLSTSSFEELEDVVNSLHSTVQMPATLLRNPALIREASDHSDKSLNVTYNKWIVQDVAIAFAKIKRIKFGYTRFRMTYWGIDVCQLSVMQRRNLCIWVSVRRGLKVDIHLPRSKVNYPCARKKITLTSREVEDLQTDTFSMWSCPADADTARSRLSVGKTHLRDTVMVYRHENVDEYAFPEGIVFPDILASNVDRYTLGISELKAEADRGRVSQLAHDSVSNIR